MLDPKKLAELDQAMAELVNFFPSMWWSLYSKSVKEGFTPDQAIVLVIEFSRELQKSGPSTE